jgi:phosphoglucomutase
MHARIRFRQLQVFICSHNSRALIRPRNNASIGGLKVVSVSGWFAARPSGTENIYKLYAESLRSANHLTAIVGQAQEIVSRSLGGSDWLVRA